MHSRTKAIATSHSALQKGLAQLIECWPVHVGKGLLAFIGEPVADAIVQEVGAVAQDEDEDDWPHMGF